MTNAEKFEEVFGFPPHQTDVCAVKFVCDDRESNGREWLIYCKEDTCPKWWDKEYEVPERLPFE